jgi:hypothetical protein
MNHLKKIIIQLSCVFIAINMYPADNDFFFLLTNNSQKEWVWEEIYFDGELYTGDYLCLKGTKFVFYGDSSYKTIPPACDGGDFYTEAVDTAFALDDSLLIFGGDTCYIQKLTMDTLKYYMVSRIDSIDPQNPGYDIHTRVVLVSAGNGGVHNQASGEEKGNEILIGPNPFSAGLTVRFGGMYDMGPRAIEVYDITGRLITRESSPRKTNKLFIHSKPGLYIIKVTIGKKVLVRKAMKTDF